MADEKKTLEIVINDAEAAKSLGDIKKSLKDIKDRMVEVGEESPEFNKLAAAAGELKEKMGQANEAIGRFNPKPVEALQGIAQKAASGVQLVTAGMALFGKESEDVQKIMMKVQAAMAFADAIKGIEGMGQAVSNLSKIVAANPLGALLTVIAALTVAIIAYYNAQVDTTSEVYKANAAYEKQKEVTEELSSQYDNQITLLQSQGASEKDIIDVKKKKIDVEIAELESSNALHKAKVREIIDNDDLQESYWRVVEAMYRKMGADKEADQIETLIKKFKLDRAKEDLDAIKENNRQIETLKTERLALDFEYAKHQAEAAKDANAELLKEQEEFNKQMLKLNADLLKARQDQQAADAAETQRLNDEADARSEEIISATIDELDAVEAAERAKRAAVRLTIEQNKYYRKVDHDFALQQASSLFDSLSQLTKKHHKLSKAFAVAQTLIDTYSAAQKAYLAQLSIPSPDSLIRAQIAAGVAVVAGLAKVAQIKAIDENGGGGGGLGGGGGAPSSIGSLSVEPSINSTAQPSTLLNEQGQVINQQQNQQPIFVSVAEIAAVSGNVTAIEERSRH